MSIENQIICEQNINEFMSQSNQLIASNYRQMGRFLSKSSSRIDQQPKSESLKKKDLKEMQKRKLIEMYNDMKLNPLNFHSRDTFGRFIKYSLNLKCDLINQILSNPRVQYWIDRNKSNGFVYQTMPNIDKRQQLPPVRCDLCKFYGHLSHTCTVKEVLRNGACRCHICGMLGHPAEAGLCPYIVCSFCHQNGHWNFMCPSKDKVSRTLCHRCQRYGHKSESCPDQWRQFDRISTYEQTPYKEADYNKPVYCYQCAQKGHYGYNCPEFHRKYFIRDYHHLDNYPVFFFASSSPFVKFPVQITEKDKEIISKLVDSPIDVRYDHLFEEEDSLAELEKFQSNIKSGCIGVNDTTFGETHTNVPLKEYIRKWSNWVVDFHWVFTLKYFIDSLPTYKLLYFIKHYPSLDNFILHWMWWSYTLSRDLERFTKDPFRAAGTTPWLLLDNCNQNKQNQTRPFENVNKIDDKNNKDGRMMKYIKTQSSKFFQYNDYTMKTVNSLLFPNENKKTSDDSANIVHKKIPTVNKRKKLARSNSCIGIYNPNTEKYKIEKDMINDSKSKSSNSSPYVHRSIPTKQQQQQPVNKLSRLDSKALLSNDNQNLKLNYVNELYHFNSNELTKALLQRIDSYSHSLKQDEDKTNTEKTNDSVISLRGLLNCDVKDDRINNESTVTTTTPNIPILESDTNDDEDEQDKTIVFDLGCCDKGSSSSLSEDEEEETDTSEKRETIIQTTQGNFNERLNLLTDHEEIEVVRRQDEVPKPADIIDLKEEEDPIEKPFNCDNECNNEFLINQSLKVNDLTQTFKPSMNQTVVYNAFTDNQQSTHNILSKLFTPITEQNNLKPNDNPLNSILDIMSDKSNKLTESKIKERIIIDSTNLIKLLLKIDSQSPATNNENLLESKLTQIRPVDTNQITKADSTLSKSDSSKTLTTITNSNSCNNIVLNPLNELTNTDNIQSECKLTEKQNKIQQKHHKLYKKQKTNQIQNENNQNKKLGYQNKRHNNNKLHQQQQQDKNQITNFCLTGPSNFPQYHSYSLNQISQYTEKNNQNHHHYHHNNYTNQYHQNNTNNYRHSYHDIYHSQPHNSSSNINSNNNHTYTNYSQNHYNQNYYPPRRTRHNQHQHQHQHHHKTMNNKRKPHSSSNSFKTRDNSNSNMHHNSQSRNSTSSQTIFKHNSEPIQPLTQSNVSRSTNTLTSTFNFPKSLSSSSSSTSFLSKTASSSSSSLLSSLHNTICINNNNRTTTTTTTNLTRTDLITDQATCTTNNNSNNDKNLNIIKLPTNNNIATGTINTNTIQNQIKTNNNNNNNNNSNNNKTKSNSINNFTNNNNGNIYSNRYTNTATINNNINTSSNNTSATNNNNNNNNKRNLVNNSRKFHQNHNNQKY